MSWRWVAGVHGRGGSMPANETSLPTFVNCTMTNQVLHRGRAWGTFGQLCPTFNFSFFSQWTSDFLYECTNSRRRNSHKTWHLQFKGVKISLGSMFVFSPLTLDLRPPRSLQIGQHSNRFVENSSRIGKVALQVLQLPRPTSPRFPYFRFWAVLPVNVLVFLKKTGTPFLGLRFRSFVKLICSKKSYPDC